MPRFIPIGSVAATAVVILASAPTATAASANHRGPRTVSVKSAWIEKGPADHPIAPAWRGDRFQITRADYVKVHHSNGSVQHWAQGTLTHRDPKTKRAFHYRGWIRVSALGDFKPAGTDAAMAPRVDASLHAAAPPRHHCGDAPANYPRAGVYNVTTQVTRCYVARNIAVRWYFRNQHSPMGYRCRAHRIADRGVVRCTHPGGRVVRFEYYVSPYYVAP